VGVPISLADSLSSTINSDRNGPEPPCSFMMDSEMVTIPTSEPRQRLVSSESRGGNALSEQLIGQMETMAVSTDHGNSTMDDAEYTIEDHTNDNIMKVPTEAEMLAANLTPEIMETLYKEVLEIMKTDSESAETIRKGVAAMVSA
jgi:hypothetical protein